MKKIIGIFIAGTLLQAAVGADIPQSASTVNVCENEISSSDIIIIRDKVIDRLMNDQPKLSFGSVGGEWAAAVIARSGHCRADDEYLTEYYETAVSEAKELSEGITPGGALNKFKSTENSRLIIALSALGKDPSDAGGIDLTAPYRDTAWTLKQGVNGAAYALIALRGCGFERGDEVIEACIGCLLEKRLSDGGWAVSGTRSDADVTAMVIQALAPYIDDDEVSAAVSGGVEILSEMQTENGGFRAFGEENSNSSSQVVMACTALGIDPKNDERFIKNGHSVLGALLDYYIDEECAFSRFQGAEADAMATEQAACALEAYERFLCGKRAFFDFGKEDGQRAAFLDVLDRETSAASKMAVAVVLPDARNGSAALFANGDFSGEFYYCEGLSEKVGENVFAGIVPADMDLKMLTDASAFTFGENSGTTLYFGDGDGNGVIDARDVMLVSSLWSGRTVENGGDRMFLAFDADGNGCIDMEDAEIIKNAFVYGEEMPAEKRMISSLGGRI